MREKQQEENMSKGEVKLVKRPDESDGVRKSEPNMGSGTYGQREKVAAGGRCDEGKEIAADGDDNG